MSTRLNIAASKEVGLDLNGKTLNLGNSSIVSVGNLSLSNTQTGGKITSTSFVLLVYGGTVNINGGSYISNNESVIVNSSSGTINITQTTTPMYISTLATNWAPALLNNSTGKLNVTANKANACTSNISDTTSGLCVYAQGDKRYTVSTANSAVANGTTGKINLNGGTYYGGNQGVNNSGDGIINIINANISSGYWSLENNSAGTINICNSQLNKMPTNASFYKDIRTYGNTGTVNYSTSVIFSTGNNNPSKDGSGINGNYSGTCLAN